jgi:hypothetical protein
LAVSFVDNELKVTGEHADATSTISAIPLTDISVLDLDPNAKTLRLFQQATAEGYPSGNVGSGVPVGNAEIRLTHIWELVGSSDFPIPLSTAVEAQRKIKLTKDIRLRAKIKLRLESSISAIRAQESGRNAMNLGVTLIVARPGGVHPISIELLFTSGPSDRSMILVGRDASYTFFTTSTEPGVINDAGPILYLGAPGLESGFWRGEQSFDIDLNIDDVLTTFEQHAADPFKHNYVTHYIEIEGKPVENPNGTKMEFIDMLFHLRVLSGTFQVTETAQIINSVDNKITADINALRLTNKKG